MFNISRHFRSSVLIAALTATVAFADNNMPEGTENLVKQCAGCHGIDGNSVSEFFPSFGGISENYFKYTMKAYQVGVRKSEMMKLYVDALSSKDIDTLARYYASQAFKPSEQKFDEELARKGQDIHNTYCFKCHGKKGEVDKYNYGILAGQWMPYLKLTMDEYLQGTRKVNPMMVVKLKRVENEVGKQGFEQLIHFYASNK